MGERKPERVKQLEIVIAEDSAAMMVLIQRLLSVITGFVVVGTATNGVEAIQLVKQFKPHVLVLDFSMPLKNGLEVIKEIRKDDSLTIIIMFTADPSPFIRDICLEAGANFYLDKSKIIELIEICNQILLAS
jgi:CheY-like chemotaxis protein